MGRYLDLARPALRASTPSADTRGVMETPVSTTGCTKSGDVFDSDTITKTTKSTKSPGEVDSLQGTKSTKSTKWQSGKSEPPQIVLRAAELFEGDVFPEGSPYLLRSETRLLDRAARLRHTGVPPWIPRCMGTPAAEANRRALERERETRGDE